MIQKEPEKPGVAYRQGWIDGRHGGPGFFTENPRLAEWEGASDRIAYYLGHREGREARKRVDGGPWLGDARGESAAPPA